MTASNNAVEPVSTKPTDESCSIPPTTGPPSDKPTAEEVVKELHKRLGQKRETSNERNSERHPWITEMTVELQSPAGDTREFNVATHDISKGGFSFVLNQFVHLGTKIRARFSGLPNRPSLDGVARSCVNVGGVHHRVGVQFISKQKDGQDRKSVK